MDFICINPFVFMGQICLTPEFTEMALRELPPPTHLKQGGRETLDFICF